MSETSAVRILTARKGYEFRLDDLRLTMLCTEPILRAIAEALGFKGVAVTTPPATFGPVQATLPAGAVFQLGTWLTPDAQMVPIRFLHIEPQRIVIDVAGPSSAVDATYQRLRAIVSEMTAPDGYPILGEPVRVLSFSELSFHLPVSPAAIFAPQVRELFTRAFPQAEPAEETILVPSLQVQALPASQEYTGDVSVADGRTFSLALRASTKPSEHALFSGAPLDTDSHQAFVASLQSALTQNARG